MLNMKRLEARAERARKLCNLTEAQLALLQSAADCVYQEIAPDLEPDIKKRSTCRRSTILEVVTDAGRLETKVRERIGAHRVEFSEEHGHFGDIPSVMFTQVKDEFSNHPLVLACRNYNKINDLIGPSFPYREYEAGLN